MQFCYCYCSVKTYIIINSYHWQQVPAFFLSPSLAPPRVVVDSDCVLRLPSYRKLPWPNLIGRLPASPIVPFAALFWMFFLISLDIVIKDYSTFIEFLADVSRKGISKCLANSEPSSKLTLRISSISHLLPTNILQTPGFANLSISCIHYLTLSKESLSVTSYTMIIPCAPL